MPVDLRLWVQEGPELAPRRRDANQPLADGHDGLRSHLYARLDQPAPTETFLSEETG